MTAHARNRPAWSPRARGRQAESRTTTMVFSNVALATAGYRRSVLVVFRDGDEPAIMVSVTRQGKRAGALFLHARDADALREAIAITRKMAGDGRVTVRTITAKNGASLRLCAHRDRGEPAVSFTFIDVDGRERGRGTFLRGEELAALEKALDALTDLAG